MKFALLCVFGFLVPSQNVIAAPAVEKAGTVEVNWKDLRLNFSSRSQAEEGFAAAKDKAWGSGLLAAKADVESFVTAKLSKLDLAQDIAENLSRESGKRVARNTFEIKTTYSADKWVFIQMQSLLTNAFNAQTLTHYGLGKNVPERRNKGLTGVLVQVTSAEPVKPAAFVSLLDPRSGQLLYGLQTVSVEAFKSRLMGKWAKSPGKQEISRVLGSSYLTIQVDADGSGKMRLANEMSDDQMQLLKVSLSHMPVLFSI